MNVTAQLPVMMSFLHQYPLEPSMQQGARPPVSPVEAAHAPSVQIVLARREVGMRHAQEDVEMVVQKDPRKPAPISLG